MLKDEQKDFLSNLPAGRAVYFTTGTEKAIQIQIKSSTDTSADPPSNDEILRRAIPYYLNHYQKGFYMGLDIFRKKPTAEQFECIKTLNQGLANDWNMDYLENHETLSSETSESIRHVIEIIGTEHLGNYMRHYENAKKLYKYIIRKFM